MGSPGLGCSEDQTEPTRKPRKGKTYRNIPWSRVSLRFSAKPEFLHYHCHYPAEHTKRCDTAQNDTGRQGERICRHTSTVGPGGGERGRDYRRFFDSLLASYTQGLTGLTPLRTYLDIAKGIRPLAVVGR